MPNARYPKYLPMDAKVTLPEQIKIDGFSQTAWTEEMIQSGASLL